MNSWPSPSSATDSPSARSISALKMTRPGVVTISSPFHAYWIGSWRPTFFCFASSANSTSSSLRTRYGRGFSFSTSAFERSTGEYVRK